MSHIEQALTSNGIAAILLISLMISFRRKFRNGDADAKVFFVMLIANLFQCIVEPITVFIDGRMFAGAIPLAKLLNSFLYIGNIIFAALWSLYADLRMQVYKHKKLDKKRFLIKYTPMMLVIFGAIVNIFTPVYFSISDQNIYERTGFFIVTYVITYLYLLLGTITAYGFVQKIDKYVFLPAFTFLFPVVLASLVQFMLPPGYSFVWAGASVGMASAYVTLLDENSSIDPLTGAYTRHYFNQHLKSIQAHSNGTSQYAGIMLDVDSFKSINDTYGHTMGDSALRNVGKILRKNVFTRGMVFRFGGDEYAVIMKIKDQNEIKEIIDKILAGAEHFNETTDHPYRIHFSIGYTIYNPGERTTDFIKRMDEAMYIDKRSHQTPSSNQISE